MKDTYHRNIQLGASRRRLEDAKNLIDAGILQYRSKPNSPSPRTYSVAKLYLYGLNMSRKGQR